MPALFVLSVAAVQLLGLASLAWARMSESSWPPALVQTVFFSMLLVVAATTAVTVALATSLWPVCAFTFGAMVVGATFSTQRESTAVV